MIRGSLGKLGEIVSLPSPNCEEKWTGALFAQAGLVKIFWGLRQGELRIPGVTYTATFPVCRLDRLGDLGPDVRRLADGFTSSTSEYSPYKGFWSHDSKKVTSLKQVPNSYLVRRMDSPKKGDYAAHLWERAGTISIAERLRSNTHRVVALRFEVPVMGASWWSFQTKDLDENQEKALVLWLNSTPSILSLYANRVVTQGSWFKMKQPSWQSMSVLDVRALDGTQLKNLAQTYDFVQGQELLSLSRLDRDATRKEIDRSLSDTLGLPQFGPIGDFLAREPGLSSTSLEDSLGDDLQDEEIKNDD